MELVRLDSQLNQVHRKKFADGIAADKKSLRKKEMQKINKFISLKAIKITEVNIMKTSKRNKLLGLALVSSCSLLSANMALAAAGDSIANRATISFSVGGATQTDIGSSPTGNTSGVGTDTVFLEDRLINFTVVRGGTTGAAIPGGTLQAVEFALTNSGNGSQGFLLKGLNNADATADPFSAMTDEFEVTAIQTFVESGVNAGFQTLEDTEAFVATLASTASVVVYVVSTIPLNDTAGNPLVNTNVAVMSLVAQVAIAGSTGIAADAVVADDNGNASPGGTGFSNGSEDVTAGVAASIVDDPLTEQTVFNDAVGTQDGISGTDIAQNAQHSDNSSYTIESAALTVTKTSVPIWDPVNLGVNPKSIPGAHVHYFITIENAAGAGDADLTTLTDVLAATVALDPDLITAAGTPAGGVEQSVRITHISNAVAVFCTGSTADADGCGYTGGNGGTLSVDINAVMGATNALLTGGQSLEILFNIIIQ